MFEDKIKKGLNYALNVISYRDRTEKELRDKMKSKEYEKDIINNVVEKLKQMHLIDDSEFAKKHIDFRIERYGIRRLKQELYKKGVSKEIIEEAFENITEDEEYRAAREITMKKLNQYSDLDIEKKYSRLMGLLSRKGYNYNIVKRVFEDLDIKRSNHYE